ncbi:hypothetical protein VZT92_016281 [Zoarces viviparus]|uniref:Uncharacterized protein n=1 Tax=Zoarces viviparus TaxID=48416 RepID=A0AAW1ESL8_ZOAVI
MVFDNDVLLFQTLTYTISYVHRADGLRRRVRTYRMRAGEVGDSCRRDRGAARVADEQARRTWDDQSYL